jgi:hypothetical protein
MKILLVYDRERINMKGHYSRGRVSENTASSQRLAEEFKVKCVKRHKDCKENGAEAATFEDSNEELICGCGERRTMKEGN